MRNKRLIIIFSILLSVTTLVLLGSIIFSVKSVIADCYNYTPSMGQEDGLTLNQRVIDSAKEISGKSIFLINDKKVIAEIEKNVPEIKVINIERIFPSRAIIHYVKMFNYFEVKVEDKQKEDTYYECLCDGKVTEKRTSPGDDYRIRVLSGISGEFNIGDYLFSGNTAFLTEITTSFERIKLDEILAATFFEFIDLVKDTEYVYIGVRNSSVTFKISGRDNFFDKLYLAYSYYCSPKFDETVNSTILVYLNTVSGKHEAVATKERYPR